MTKICIICGKPFEPKPANKTYCNNTHLVKCRMCNKEICLDGEANVLKRRMYIQKGYAYCSHKCSCEGIGLDKWESENKKVDLDKLKYLKINTNKTDTEIAQELNTSLDFVISRCKKYNWTKLPEYEQERICLKNKTISNTLKQKYLDETIKADMVKKQKATYKQKTGYTHNSKNPESIAKAKSTKLAKYNNESYTNPDKMMQTKLKLYGSKYASPEGIAQGILKRTEKYGSDYIVDKGRQTKLNKYGYAGYTNPDKISETWNNKTYEEKQRIVSKQQTTCIKRYGVRNPMQTQALRDRVKQTCIEKYGVDNPFKSKDIKDKIHEINLQKYGTKYPVVLYSYMNGKTISNINKAVYQQLVDNNIDCELEKRINDNSYDIFVKPNILLEIDPTYTHNSSIGPIMFGNQTNPKDKNYHKNKTINAVNNGYRCIHIWDWEDKNKIISSLQHKSNIYARKCTIKEIDKKQCDEFLNSYHIQNTCNRQTIRLGLYYNQELVQVMTFGKPRYNKNYEYELLRLCTKFKVNVIGGASKLFKYFLNNYNPKSIVSYCDLSKFSGDVYKILGMSLKRISSPSKHWYNTKTKRHITDNLLRQRGFSQLHKDNDYLIHKKGDDNNELMLDAGYVVIYDCGQATYEWYSINNTN